MATENIITGKKYRILIDEINKIWQRISFWTKASDVEFNDGQNAESKVGVIQGITSDVNGESDNVAASIKVVNELNNNLVNENGEIFRFGVDSEGNRGYIITDETGADAVIPFKSGGTQKITSLGVGTSFNVSGYDGYQNFTKYNFVVETYAGGSTTGGATPSHISTWSGGVSGFTINTNYNQNTGVFSIYGNSQTVYLYRDGNSWVTNGQEITCMVYLVTYE